MPVCPKCGVEVAEDAKFCNICGAPLTEEQSKTEEKKSTVDSVKELNNTKDTTAEFDPADIEKNKILCLFSYLGILFLIPLLACQDSKFARYHVNQGIILFLADLIIGAVAIIPILGWIAAGVGGIVIFVLMIIGIVNAVQGRAKELPIIGKFRLLK
ncbi:MAG: zinc-ribbon domain-containing protein [Clostridia bacterium]|nr:zinc-ribbon domain-containing protein [Clostridia bacterium]